MAHVLVVDDDPQFLRLIELHIQKQAPKATVVTCRTPWDALKLMDENPPSLVITDLLIPGANGLDVAGAARRRGIPCVLCSGVPEILGPGSGAVSKDEILAHVVKLLLASIPTLKDST